MRDHVRFRSLAFAPTRAEAAETNPGRYGFELATWLASKLEARGVVVAEPFAEDWGWMIQTGDADHPAAIACGNADGSREEWLVWVEPTRTSFARRLLGGQPARDDGRAALLDTIDRVLREEPSISRIEWFTMMSDMSEIDHDDHPQ